MKLTSQMIKDKAKELGIDCIAIGNIERFKEAPFLMSPSTYFPGAKSVIAVAMRIPRGTYRGIEEGTHWHNYTFYSYNKLNAYFRPVFPTSFPASLRITATRRWHTTLPCPRATAPRQSPCATAFPPTSFALCA